MADLWQKVQSLGAVLGGIGAIMIPFAISTCTDRSQRSSVYMQIMTEREKSDTELRRAMFTELMDKYLGDFKDTAHYNEKVLRKRIMFLDLLSLNFQEYMNAKPLFEHVYWQLEQAKTASISAHDIKTINSLLDDLFKVAKRIASKQAVMLSNSGEKLEFTIKMDEFACIRLYDTSPVKRADKNNSSTSIQGIEGGNCMQFPDSESSGPLSGQAFPSIEVRLKEVRAERVKVEVKPYKDFYRNGTLTGSKMGIPIEFEVSPFDMPYMDNTKLFDGTRFALVLEQHNPDRVQFNAVMFKEQFVSLRDRPFFEEMLTKLRLGHSDSWSSFLTGGEEHK
jgi:hypothetical protein